MCSHAKDLAKTWMLFWEIPLSLAGGSFVGPVTQLKHDHPTIHPLKKTFTHTHFPKSNNNLQTHKQHKLQCINKKALLTTPFIAGDNIIGDIIHNNIIPLLLLPINNQDMVSSCVDNQDMVSSCAEQVSTRLCHFKYAKPYFKCRTVQ